MATATVTTKSHIYASLNSCQYCNINDPLIELSNEHIIAYGLGGRLVLPKSSCNACSVITGAIEEHCLKRLFGDTRFYMGIKSRKRGIPKTAPIELANNLETSTIQVPINDFPACLLMFSFPNFPEILLGFPPKEEFAGQVCLRPLSKNVNKYGKIKLLSNPTKSLAFGRMLAKIAHSYAIAELGINSFIPYLENLILGKKPLYPSQFIGGSIIKEPKGTELHEIRIEQRQDKFIVVRIHLFSSYDMPVHYVVAGEYI